MKMGILRDVLDNRGYLIQRILFVFYFYVLSKDINRVKIFFCRRFADHHGVWLIQSGSCITFYSRECKYIEESRVSMSYMLFIYVLISFFYEFITIEGIEARILFNLRIIFFQ